MATQSTINANLCSTQTRFAESIENLFAATEQESFSNLPEKIASAQPLQSECARFGKRALSWALWIPGLSQNSFLDRNQLEFSHEHLF